MATTDLRNSIRSMSAEERGVALAVTIVMDRIRRLSKEDRDDLFALVKELIGATTDEDRFGICDTMVEILDGRSVSVEPADLTDTSGQPERLQKWVGWVSKKIRDARTEAGLTQEQLAAKTGLPQSHISRIENAKHSPSRTTIEKIAGALGKPVTFFDPS
ncbi:MAG: helix-turn-helix transcriptional regulator [Phycisphaeraceae bacterium]|nr:helix-turn-helix transcriptional regulator [Phycisphaeraceae bacterium]